jgi:hypothetical protein
LEKADEIVPKSDLIVKRSTVGETMGKVIIGKPTQIRCVMHQYLDEESLTIRNFRADLRNRLCTFLEKHD